MPWKLMGGALVLVSAAAIGGTFAGRVKEQEVWLKEIKLVFLLLGGELNYNKTPLPEAFILVARRHDGPLTPFLKKVGEELTEQNGRMLKELWAAQAGQILLKAPLLKSQKQEFAALGECFSETDSTARENAIAFYLKRLEAELEHLEQTGRDKAYLYRMLGMLGGLFLLVLIL
ncbi:MAG: stage III sporulation protein AB [Lachnospiraceae bacterium]